MKALLQRVSKASVAIDGQVVGEIGAGVLILLCAMQGDSDQEFEALLTKILGLRIFSDDQGRMNLSCEDIKGEYLVVSQFTLAANTKKGKRPSFVAAMAPEEAEKTYLRFCETLAERSGRPVAEGRFGADMQVSLTNDGPVTIPLDYPPSQDEA